MAFDTKKTVKNVKNECLKGLDFKRRRTSFST
jgi:hypothetical protein